MEKGYEGKLAGVFKKRGKTRECQKCLENDETRLATIEDEIME